MSSTLPGIENTTSKTGKPKLSNVSALTCKPSAITVTGSDTCPTNVPPTPSAAAPHGTLIGMPSASKNSKKNWSEAENVVTDAPVSKMENASRSLGSTMSKLSPIAGEAENGVKNSNVRV